jgi:cell division protein FtsB
MLIAVVPRAKSIYDLYAIKKTLLQQKAQLTQVNQERTQTLAEIDTPQGMEKLAREQLGMVKKGERTIIKVIP